MSLLRLLSSGLSIVIVLAALGVTLVGFGERKKFAIAI